MTEENHNQIMLSIGELKGLMVGIAQRMDAANHKVGKLEAKVEILEKNQSKSDGRLSAYSWVFGAIIGIGGLLLAALQFYSSFIKSSRLP